MIPDNPSAPRYNTVLGAPRKPALNPNATASDGQSRNDMMSAPVTPVAESDTPPPMAYAPTPDAVIANAGLANATLVRFTTSTRS